MKTKEYPLIPMSEITDEAREIAVAWMECEDKNWIGQKHKLASDIMNYARQENARLTAINEKQAELLKIIYNRHGFLKIDLPLLKEIESLQAGEGKEDNTMFLNMQYYMEYCIAEGYLTPQDWIKNYKHF